jgi:hypothetical protein
MDKFRQLFPQLPFIQEERGRRPLFPQQSTIAGSPCVCCAHFLAAYSGLVPFDRVVFLPDSFPLVETATALPFITGTQFKQGLNARELHRTEGRAALRPCLPFHL